MIAALTSPNMVQFERAQYWNCSRQDFRKNINKFQVIGVERVSEQTLRYNAVYSNVVTTDGSIVLQTKYKHSYDAKQIIRYRGVFYEIVSVQEIAGMETPQNLRYVKGVNWAYALELTRVTIEDL